MSGLRLVEADECWEGGEAFSPENGLSTKPREPAGHESAERRLARLASTIEGEIIPRLMLAHRAVPQSPAPTSLDARIIATDDVEGFAKLILTSDVGPAAERIEALRREGVSLEAVFLDLLAPAARRLGEYWQQDVCDFTEVTVGLSRLHLIVRQLSPAFENEVEPSPHGRRALLAPAPGDQHSLGLLMVEEFFRRAGWDVWGGSAITAGDAVEIVRGEWFAVAGFSASCESLLDELASVIRAVRKASLNPGIRVLVGGRVFVEHPDYVARVGADATAVDGRRAVLQTHRLLEPRAVHI